MQKIAMMAFDNLDYCGNRFLVVQAKEKAFDFYKKLGFEFSTETRREKNRFITKGTRTMFMDLKLLRALLDIQ